MTCACCASAIPLAEANAPYSVELCGGTHVARTGDIARVRHHVEGGVAQGVRRIEGVTGAAALDFLKSRGAIAREIADQFKSPIADAPRASRSWLNSARSSRPNCADASKLAMGGGGAAAGPEEGQRRQVHRQGRRCAGEGSQGPGRRSRRNRSARASWCLSRQPKARRRSSSA